MDNLELPTPYIELIVLCAVAARVVPIRIILFKRMISNYVKRGLENLVRTCEQKNLKNY
jgi:hypothetical protein